jgi:hypothetical protein
MLRQVAEKNGAVKLKNKSSSISVAKKGSSSVSLSD